MLFSLFTSSILAADDTGDYSVLKYGQVVSFIRGTEITPRCDGKPDDYLLTTVKKHGIMELEDGTPIELMSNGDFVAYEATANFRGDIISSFLAYVFKGQTLIYNRQYVVATEDVMFSYKTNDDPTAIPKEICLTRFGRVINSLVLTGKSTKDTLVKVDDRYILVPKGSHAGVYYQNYIMNGNPLIRITSRGNIKVKAASGRIKYRKIKTTWV